MSAQKNLVPEEDRLHPPGDDDSWFESYWFAFHVPERAIMVYVYPWFRTKLNLYGGGVQAWDNSGGAPWSILYNDYSWARRFDGPASLIEGTSINTPQGVRIDCLPGENHYRIRYDRPGLAFDVTYKSVGEANRTTASAAETGIFNGHIDQPGHCTGTLRLGEETFPIDCHTIRDRSWGPRRDDNYDMHVGYYYATASKSDAFMMIGHEGPSADEFGMISGYLIREGVRSPLLTASARIVRDDEHAPITCHITATDELGRTMEAHGKAMSTAGMQQQPGMFSWCSLASWTFSGVEAYGELQESWHPDAYRAFVRKQQP